LICLGFLQIVKDVLLVLSICVETIIGVLVVLEKNRRKKDGSQIGMVNMIVNYYLIYSSPSGSIITSSHPSLSEVYQVILDFQLQLGYYTIIKGEKVV
jgi:hypothetical protein